MQIGFTQILLVIALIGIVVLVIKSWSKNKAPLKRASNRHESKAAQVRDQTSAGISAQRYAATPSADPHSAQALAAPSAMVSTAEIAVPTPTTTSTPALTAIDAFYGNELNVIELGADDYGQLISAKALKDLATSVVEEFASKRGNVSNKGALGQLAGSGAITTGVGLVAGYTMAGFAKWDEAKAARLTRQLALRVSLISLPPRDRATLRLGAVLDAMGHLNRDDLTRVRLALLAEYGAIVMPEDANESALYRDLVKKAFRVLVSGTVGEPIAAREVVQAALRGALERGGTDAVVLERYLFEGNHWLDPVTTGGLPDAAPDALSLGRFPSGGDYWYPHRESLVTIAGPGTGKSSSLMLRNLLRLGTGAIVLDIKGEAYAASADWRSRNVGPVMHFSPDRPNHSVCYNPLDSVGNDLRTVWSEARRLAELLTVPVSRGDQFFEQRAKTLIAAAVATVALTAPLSDRNMRAVLRYLYLSASKPSVEDSELAGWVEQVRPLGVEVLASEVRALVDAPEKQREAVFESARNQLSAWWDDNISAITRVTMVNAKVLREQRGTLFICIRLEDIAPLRSVLRAVIGGLMRELMQDGPETKAETVTLFLDELPQLGRLDVVDQALAVGRGYGIRLWLFAQDTGQLRTIYENADGMMERCRVRIFMNPSEVDAIAMSRWLGERRGLLDGERKALAEPYTLSGPEFRDDVIVFQRSTLPARLRKVFPWDDRETAPRMGTAQTSREPPSVGSSE